MLPGIWGVSSAKLLHMRSSSRSPSRALLLACLCYCICVGANFSQMPSWLSFFSPSYMSHCLPPRAGCTPLRWGQHTYCVVAERDFMPWPKFGDALLERVKVHQWAVGMSVENQCLGTRCEDHKVDVLTRETIPEQVSLLKSIRAPHIPHGTYIGWWGKKSKKKEMPQFSWKGICLCFSAETTDFGWGNA